jgi:hypothetical protein
VASLQLRNGSWRVIFRYRGLQHFVTISEVDEAEAQGVKARYQYLLRLLKQRLLTLPAGMDIVTFLGHDGKPPATKSETHQPETTFARLREYAFRRSRRIRYRDGACPLYPFLRLFRMPERRAHGPEASPKRTTPAANVAGREF